MKKSLEKSMKLKRKVYSGWTLTENENEKRDINYSIYKDVAGKAVVKRVGTTYNREIYKIVENKHDLSDDELALICDGGNLCFGYNVTENGSISVYTD